MNVGNGWTRSILLLFCAATTLFASAQAAQSCLNCHASLQQGFATPHAALAQNCTQCHAGDGAANSAAAAHRGLIAFPGDMDSAGRACGGCHADKVKAVTQGLMHTGAGMVATTRSAFGELTDRPGRNDLAHLTHSPADSLLRKLCASCHLGQKNPPTASIRRMTAVAAVSPATSTTIRPTPIRRSPRSVSDARCFGCHSHSGRICTELRRPRRNGRAEANHPLRHLEDGRAVEQHVDDVHHAAGMSCSDCHTEADIMGVGEHAAHKSAAVDIACEDCHANGLARLDAAHWPMQYRALLAKVPYPVGASTRFLVTARRGTPLWNIEVSSDGVWLYRKQGRAPLPIPPMIGTSHPFANEHHRVSCAACHSQWAAQCYGCHLELRHQRRTVGSCRGRRHHGCLGGTARRGAQRPAAARGRRGRPHRAGRTGHDHDRQPSRLAATAHRSPLRGTFAAHHRARPRMRKLPPFADGAGSRQRRAAADGGRMALHAGRKGLGRRPARRRLDASRRARGRVETKAACARFSAAELRRILDVALERLKDGRKN